MTQLTENHAVLITVKRGGESWGFTPRSTEVELTTENTLGVEEYFEPTAISIGDVELGGDAARDGVILTVARDLEPFSDLLTQEYALPLEINIRIGFLLTGSSITHVNADRCHWDTRYVFVGRAVAAKAVDLASIKVSCVSLLSDAAKPTIRRTFSSQCGHRFLDKLCSANLNNRTVSTTITGINRDTGVLEIANNGGFDDGWFDRGFITLADGDKRAIAKHQGLNLHMAQRLPARIQIGDALHLTPGCDHTLAMCANKFFNSDRYGGWVSIPVDNVFK